MTGQDVYKANRLYILDNSPFSEMFTVEGSSNTFKGIFDRYFSEGAQDKGNVTNRKFITCVLCASTPAELIPRVSKIIRSNGDTYIFSYAGVDEEGITYLWLI